jgi:acyl transferase domain-containing protein
MTESVDGAVAIIGMACRFPGARTVAEFWANLRDGVESIRPLADDVLEAPPLGPDPRRDPAYVKAAARLDDVDQFDAAFFGYTPIDAAVMDPQQRLLLECAWAALEDAGYDPAREARAIGVFAGSRTNTYLLNLVANRRTVRELDAVEIGLGNDLGFLATRVSYQLDLRGPSCAVQTACSTSLVAVHLACESVLVGDSDLALAGGVTVNVPQAAGYLYRPGAMLSPDGHCRAFSADAAGTVFGSGVGLVVLKRYADAVADHDTIHALIRGTAINNDGGQKASFTAPAVDGQAALVRDALAHAGVTADTIGYVETHGTGTPLGDPIEIHALTQAFRPTTTAGRPRCPIGSVKPNIGHLDAAAGIASLIKTTLMLTHRAIPPSLHSEPPSPHIDFASTPFYVNTRLTPWEGPTPRRAGVSSFGVGGTNAHAVLEEAPPRPAPPPRPDAQLLVLSARTASALHQRAAALADHLTRVPVPLADVAHTLAIGRRAFAHRWSGVCRDRDDAVRALRAVADAPPRPAEDVDARAVAFLFPGQGAPIAGVGAALYETQPVFRAQVDRCAAVLDPLIAGDLRAILFGDAAADRQATRLAQPALFTIALALARQWQHWGVTPRALLGHSVGEYVAACLAGVLAEDDALQLVALRGRLMQAMPPGGMLAVALAPTSLEPLVPDTLDLAAVNGPASCVVSGPLDAIAACEAQLTGQGVVTTRLAVSHAFHSRAMDGVLDAFTAAVARTPRQPPRIPYLSTLTGTWITAADVADPSYWSRHLRGTVRFADALATLVGDRPQVLLEVGPGATLTGLSRRATIAARAPHVALASLDGGEAVDAATTLRQTLGQVWEARAAVDWRRVDDHHVRYRVSLPTYPFERRRHWIDPDRTPDTPAIADAADTAARIADETAWFATPAWQSADAIVATARPGTVLVCAEADGLVDAVAAHLATTGGAAAIVTVRRATAFARLDAHTYALDPAQPAHYDALLQACRETAGAPVTHVVHGWSLTGDTAAFGARLAAVRVGAFDSLVALARLGLPDARGAAVDRRRHRRRPRRHGRRDAASRAGAGARPVPRDPAGAAARALPAGGRGPGRCGYAPGRRRADRARAGRRRRRPGRLLSPAPPLDPVRRAPRPRAAGGPGVSPGWRLPRDRRPRRRRRDRRRASGAIGRGDAGAAVPHRAPAARAVGAGRRHRPRSGSPGAARPAPPHRARRRDGAPDRG